MNVMLVFMDVHSYHQIDYHFGLGYIAAVLKKHSRQVSLVTIHSQKEFPSVIRKIGEFKPGVIGITSVETQFSYVCQLAELVKENYQIPVVCGGTYTTLYPQAIREGHFLDGVFIGECESAFLEFINKIENNEDFRTTSNFAYYDRKENRLVVNELLPIVHDLDQIPFPDREICDYQDVINRNFRAYFFFNRGCPYQCNYCANHALAKQYGGLKYTIRRRSVEGCIKEIAEVLSKYNVFSKRISIEDELFTIDNAWLYSFLEAFKSEFKGYSFACCTRCNLATEEMFLRLKEAGCFQVMMSVESGNDFIRNKVMKRIISREQIVKSFQLARKYKIKTNGPCIIGLPFETKEMVMDTINLVGECNVDNCGVNVFYPYVGTKLRKVCEENNMIPLNKDLTVLDRRESILINNTITKDEIDYFMKNWSLLINQYKPCYSKWRYLCFWLREWVKNMDFYKKYFRDNYYFKRLRYSPLIQRFFRV